MAISIAASLYTIYFQLTNILQITLIIFSIILVFFAWISAANDQKTNLELHDKLHDETRKEISKDFTKIIQDNKLNKQTYAILNLDDFSFINSNNISAISDHGRNIISLNFIDPIQNYGVNISDNIKFNVLQKTSRFAKIEFEDGLDKKRVVKISIDSTN